MGSSPEIRPLFIDGLYAELLSRGIAYFLPGYSLTATGPAANGNMPVLTIEAANKEVLELEWLGTRYTLSHPSQAITDQQFKLVQSIGEVLSARYHFLFNSDLAAQALNLYRGVPEDRYVSAFLDSSSHRNQVSHASDRIAEAIGVLRVTSLMTYENRRIATGALLFGSHPDACHPLPTSPEGAVPYGDALTSIKSFHRLCDGLQTVALVDRQGLLVELIEVQQWAKPYENLPLPVPSAARYEAHSRATLCGGHIFLVLTPNGEIKIFADGTQVFNFLDGRWRLTDAVEKYIRWESAVGDRALAERIFTVALNLADARRGCLFVILDNPDTPNQILAADDLVTSAGSGTESTGSRKQKLHYLLRGKRVLDLPPPVLESVARIDGAIVLDRTSCLLAFGAILHPSQTPAAALSSTEGGRTTAALNASLFGKVLKVSEDGLIAFYEQGEQIWEM